MDAFHAIVRDIEEARARLAAISGQSPEAQLERMVLTATIAELEAALQRMSQQE